MVLVQDKRDILYEFIHLFHVNQQPQKKSTRLDQSSALLHQSLTDQIHSAPSLFFKITQNTMHCVAGYQLLCWYQSSEDGR